MSNCGGRDSKQNNVHSCFAFFKAAENIMKDDQLGFDIYIYIYISFSFFRICECPFIMSIFYLSGRWLYDVLSV